MSTTLPRPSPPFTPEQDDLRASIRAFVETELRPHAASWEAAHWFPDEVFGAMAREGLLGLKYPVAHGGRGGTYLDDAVLTEELARCGSGGLAAGIGAHIGIATPPIHKFGTEDQKARYLAPAIAGEKIAALAITEPDAGSDVAAIRTLATPVDGGWLVNGSKMFITNGVRADVYVTAVKTTAQGGHKSLSFLLVDKQDGVRASAIEKLGWQASDTALIAFEDVFVPAENLLGREHEGFYLIMANFQWERLLMALGAVAAMQGALDRAVALGPAGQAHRHALADIATTIAAGRALTYHALRLFLHDIDATREVTEAKLATQRACFDVMDRLLGLAPDDDELARAARDARLGPIGGGTDEIMREILGRQMGL